MRDWLGQHIAGAPQLATSDTAWLSTLRGRVRSEFAHSQSKAAFKKEFATQAGTLAVATFSAKATALQTAWALATILRDLNLPETIDAFVAGLKSPHAVVRLLCVEGLRDQRSAWSEDDALLSKVVAALLSVGKTDAAAQPVVLTHVYLTLALPDQMDDVFDAFMALLDVRWRSRLNPDVKADGAEKEAYLFFVSSNLLQGLSVARKQKLVGHIATFFMIDARRFGHEKLDYLEYDTLFRMLVIEEQILLALVPGQQSVIESAFKTQGVLAAAAVMQQVKVWVGDPQNAAAGVLNVAPWNVPKGGIPAGDNPAGVNP